MLLMSVYDLSMAVGYLQTPACIIENTINDNVGRAHTGRRKVLAAILLAGKELLCICD